MERQTPVLLVDAPGPVGAPVAPRGPRRDQAGVSLIEVLISVFLVSLVVLGLAAGFLTIVRVNADTAERQVVDQAIGSYTESLTTAQYLPCDDPTQPGSIVAYTSTYPAGSWTPTPASGVTANIVGVEYWNGTSGFADACPGTPAADDQGAQRLTVEVAYRDTQRKAQIVKRSR